MTDHSSARRLLCVLLGVLWACDRAGAKPKPPSAGSADQTLPGDAAAPVRGRRCDGEGCPCEEPREPVTCYLPPIPGDDGAPLCAQGARYCRHGAWTACESLLDLTVADGGVDDAGLSSSSDSIIGAVGSCNPCHPDCFAAVDRPVAADLDAGNSSGVSYAPDAGGLVLGLTQDTVVATSTLVGAWTFNEGSGSVASDSSTRNRPFALTNATWSSGKGGSAGKFNGSSSYGSTTGSVVQTDQSFTVSAWVYLEALNGWRTFVNQDGVNVSGFWLQYSEALGNKFSMTMHDVDSTWSNAYRAVSTTSPVVGQWYHVVGVRNKAAASLKVYVNGALEATTTYTGGWASNGSFNVGRGRWGGPNDWFPGRIDEVQVFTSALSDADVRVLYNLGTPVTSVAVCGNAALESTEECDDGNAASGDGCSAACAVEAGYACPTVGAACVRSVCGNGVREGIEQCDDGNKLIGDGCTFLCTKEPSCVSGQPCTPVCGDGQVYPTEACDDGNVRSGDGCSATCTLEPGFSCVSSGGTPPPYIDLPVVYRDFVGLGLATTSGTPYRHADFENYGFTPTTGMVQSTWETNTSLATYKKPVASSPLKSPALQSAPQFLQWYADVPSVNRTFADTLRVTRQPDGTYVFDSGAFFPLDGKAGTWTAGGYENTSDGHNFGFTSEVRFWFTYSPPQSLSFSGDDDVWVFINSKLAVDIGGVHGAMSGSVTLNATSAPGFNLTPGKIYEAAVFQAERHTNGSGYRLTLANFVASKTLCSSVCGDGIVTAMEACDDGALNGTFGACRTDCSGRAPKYVTSGSYWRDYAAGATCTIPPERPIWGDVSWTALSLGSGSIAFTLQASETQAGLASAPSVTLPVSTTTGQLDIRSALLQAGLRYDGPFLRVTALLTAGDVQLSTPVLQQFDVFYTCAFGE